MRSPKDSAFPAPFGLEAARSTAETDRSPPQGHSPQTGVAPADDAARGAHTHATAATNTQGKTWPVAQTGPLHPAIAALHPAFPGIEQSIATESPRQPDRLRSLVRNRAIEVPKVGPTVGPSLPHQSAPLDSHFIRSVAGVSCSPPPTKTNGLDQFLGPSRISFSSCPLHTPPADSLQTTLLALSLWFARGVGNRQRIAILDTTPR